VALRRPISSDAVHLSNPANVEYQVVRTTLLPGLLKTLQHNKSASFTKGFKIFEVSDVVVKDSTDAVCGTVIGAKNIRRICAVYAGPTSGFEIIHGLVDRIMTLCEVCPEEDYIKNSSRGEEEKYRVVKEGWYYTISSLDECSTSGTSSVKAAAACGTYFPGRSAALLLTNPRVGKRVNIGSFGILHPEVLKEFDIQYPASCVEIDLEPLL
jgi:phenylalanyl-tRNA synthetase beta chain